MRFICLMQEKLLLRSGKQLLGIQLEKRKISVFYYTLNIYDGVAEPIK